MKKLTDYQKYKNYPRSRFELWSDQWNHTGAMIRTIASLLSILINALVFLRVFGKL